MKRVLLFIAIVFIANLCLAQDVIVKKDGSTILSKVLEVNINDVKYKKFSNPNGPTYTISKTELTSINYENGDLDVFTEVKSSADSNLRPSIETNFKQNKERIDSYNSFTLKYVGDKVGSNAKRAYFALALSEQSILEDENVLCEVSIGQISMGRVRGVQSLPKFSKIFSKGLGSRYSYFLNQALQITLTNKTNQTIYVDLANSFYRRGKEASAYYIPQASSSSHSTTTGMGVALPTSFGVVGLGSSQTHAVTVTTYTERIIAIPPHSSKSLEAEMLFPNKYEGTDGLKVDYSSSRDGYYPIVHIGKQQFNNGDIVSYTSENSPIQIGAYLTYGSDEQLSTKNHLEVSMYAKSVIGFPYPSGAAAFCANAEKYIETNGTPLHFITVIDEGEGRNGVMLIGK